MNDKNTKKVIGPVLIVISGTLYFLAYIISPASRFLYFAPGIWGLFFLQPVNRGHDVDSKSVFSRHFLAIS